MSGNGKVSPSELPRSRSVTSGQENVELDLFGVDDGKSITHYMSCNKAEEIQREGKIKTDVLP